MRLGLWVKIPCFAEKMFGTMKRSLNLIIASSILLSACDPFPSLTLGRNDSPGSRDPQQKDSNSWGAGTKVIPDIYVCGVEYKDHKAANLVLLRNAQKILELPVGGNSKVSAESDSHFLIGKELYTSCCLENSTIICLNGEELFCVDRAEYFTQILPFLDDVWTVSYGLQSNSMCLRKNGQLMLECPGGKAGKMYADHDKLCFRYSNTVGEELQLFHVENGAQSAVKQNGKRLLLDVRSIGGKCWTLGFEGDKYYLDNGTDCLSFPKRYGFSRIDSEIVAKGDEEPMAIIHMKSNYGPMPADQIFMNGEDFLIGAGSTNYYYLDNQPFMKATFDREAEKLHLCLLPDEEYAILENVRMSSERCACTCEGKMYLCLQAKDSPEKSFIWADGETVNIDMAFVPSGISLASSAGGSDLPEP